MITNYEVHPVAALFPMLPAEDLKALAADIKQRGLLHPIVLDAEDRVLDGRNRLAACELAETEPVFVQYEGDDPDGYALAVNGQRRDMSKGRKAMVAARSLVETTKSANAAAKAIGVSQSLMAHAVMVRDHAPDLVDSVIAGAMALDPALEIARKSKQSGESNEVRLVRLRDAAPDLADQVVEERLTLSDAEAVLEKREKELADARRDSTALLNRIIGLTVPNGADPERFVTDWAPNIVLNEIDYGRLDKTIHTLTRLKETLWTSQNT